MQKHLHIIALGPALPISKKDAFDAINIYSEKDHVTKRFAKQYLDDPDYEIKIVPCISSWDQRSFYIADHAMDGNTYDTALDKGIQKARIEYGFYDENIP